MRGDWRVSMLAERAPSEGPRSTRAVETTPVASLETDREKDVESREPTREGLTISMNWLRMCACVLVPNGCGDRTLMMPTTPIRIRLGEDGQLIVQLR